MEEESQAGTGRDPLGETPGLGRGGVSRSEAAPARRAPAAGSSRSQEMGCLAPRFTKDQRKQSEAQDAAGARGQGCSLPQLRRTDPPGFRPSAAAGLRPPLASAPRSGAPRERTRFVTREPFPSEQRTSREPGGPSPGTRSAPPRWKARVRASYSGGPKLPCVTLRMDAFETARPACVRTGALVWKAAS